METITIPITEYNALVNKAKSLENEAFKHVVEMLRDDEFFRKITTLHALFQNVGTRISEETQSETNADIYTLQGKLLSQQEFQDEINKVRNEVEKGEFVTYDSLVKEMNDE